MSKKITIKKKEKSSEEETIKTKDKVKSEIDTKTVVKFKRKTRDERKAVAPVLKREELKKFALNRAFGNYPRAEEKFELEKARLKEIGVETEPINYAKYVPEWDEELELDDNIHEIIAYALFNRLNLLLVGPTGCGKSSQNRQTCSLLDAPMMTFRCSGESTVDSLVGKWTIRGDQMVWLDGAATFCYRHGLVLNLEELDGAPAPVLFALHNYLEVKTDRIFLAEKDNEAVLRHPDFCCLASANTIGKGDDSFLYVGTTLLNEAFLNRFIVKKIDFLPQEKEIRAIANITGCPKETAQRIVACAKEVRLAFNNESITTIISTRNNIQWADMMVNLTGSTALEAAENCFINRMVNEDALFVKKVIENRFGTDYRLEPVDSGSGVKEKSDTTDIKK